jgi:sporulation protein YlmC with PRC-barrel domain
MLINRNQLIDLRVVTKNGQVLGKVKDIVIDTDNLSIKQIVVSKAKILDKILTKELVIASDQIIEITDKNIIVSDNTVNVVEGAKQTASA